MNRKLHNSLLAFSATGLMLVFGLMAATPLQPASLDQDQDLQAALPELTVTPVIAAGQADIAAVRERAEAVNARIDARASRLQDELGRSRSLGDTIASVTAFAAEVSTDAALSAVIQAADQAAVEREADSEEARHAKRVRSVLAVPYFSFAQGLRRNSRS